MVERDFLETAYDLETTKQVRAHYEAWSVTYDTEIGGQHNYAQPTRCAVALASTITPDGARVLDVGCGSGLSGLALREVGFTAIDGCDLSPAMLKLADRTDVYDDLFEADLNQRLEPPHDVYDAVAAVGVFSFGHLKATVLRDLLAVIRPGGALVVGLNDHFWDEGSLPAELNSIEADGTAEVVFREHGDHLPGAGIEGWVVVLSKLANDA
ncbi:MAG TPA: class I SAM-dependent methyltransferase [Acidimicrobiales bacterium]|jgi:predicted TPR repeat methyltransferase|nr:methyltransferase type 11 [Actinomycetota bacterium]MDP6062245.1 class I SAM-dependent methyltransferase [Acidimicrobiales bacterium]MDP7209055.1 class I SAM-dependent methyltransferase [Acidimicrobiales bacterium]HJL90083.1 class I SAM-dependent methyltransferase [Acidimicrobiales bacterium]HJO99992.1 class I SAM-dependent methyltransferase [Acidimicrobiales bacterium]|tara:strand:- start:34510 stop:35142 length:633 start_codon:yes stop_codon:yes gene_type:complete